MRKKILFIITKANWGGAQRYVFDLVTHLPKDQFEVAVALGGTGTLQKRLHDAGIPVIQLKSVQRDLSMGTDVAGFANIYRTIRSYRPDVVHLNSSKAGGLGALAARLCGTPRIIFTAHGWPFMEKKRNPAWRLFALLGSWETALLSKKVICVSDHELKIARRMPFVRNKAVRIYNGIDFTMRFGLGNVIRNSFPPGVKITGTVGELNQNKNQQALIEEAKNNSAMYVAIVGEGEMRGALEALIRKYGLASRVKLFGFIPASEVMRGFDRFALPSLKEGLGYVLLEARAAGLPIIANRIGGVSEALEKPMSEFSLQKMVSKTAALY